MRSQEPLRPAAQAGQRWLDAARLAAEHRLDHGPSARQGAALHVADDLVAGNEREADEVLEVARAAAVQGGEVRAADAGQAGPDPHPAGARELGRLQFEELERADTDAPARARQAEATRAAAKRGRLRSN